MTEFMVAEKSDGVRYLLVMGTLEKNVDNKQHQQHTRRGFAVFVNRRMQMYEVAVTASSEYFRGSVFDGELVIENVTAHEKRQLFLIFDTVSVKGDSFRHQHLLQRYHAYTPIFDIHDKDILHFPVFEWERIAFELAEQQDKIVSLGNRYALQFRPKAFVSFIHLGSLWRSLHNRVKHGVNVTSLPEICTTSTPELCTTSKLYTTTTNTTSNTTSTTTSLLSSIQSQKHSLDGLIISRINQPVQTGSDTTCFKWKAVHTVDLIVDGKYSKGSWNYSLFFQDEKDLVNCQDKAFLLDIDPTPSTPSTPSTVDVCITVVPTTPHFIKIKSNSTLQSTSKFFGEANQNTFRLLGEFVCAIDHDGKAVWCTVDRWRKDKQTPNNYHVIHKTLKNIQENITIDDLLKMVTQQTYNIQK
jgi:hypothetical protein